MARSAGVTCVLIKVDGEGDLSTGEPDERKQALANHKKWIDAAAVLECQAIRLSTGHHFRANLLWPVDDSCATLAEYGAKQGIRVLCGVDTGPSSHPDTIVALMKAVNHPNLGVLVNFGNFPHHAGRFKIDIYEAIARLMPYAKGVSAMSYDFNADGRETRFDYARILKIVTGAGYHGFVGIESEGERLSEPEGIKATKRLLESLRGSTYHPGA